MQDTLEVFGPPFIILEFFQALSFILHILILDNSRRTLAIRYRNI